MNTDLITRLSNTSIHPTTSTASNTVEETDESMDYCSDEWEVPDYDRWAKKYKRKRRDAVAHIEWH